MLSRIRQILFLAFYVIAPHQYFISVAEANEERLIGGYRLIDRGASASSNRYIVILDKIDLSETLKKEYIITELPHVKRLQLTFIYEIDRNDYNKIGLSVRERISNVQIELIVRNRKTGKVGYKYRGKILGIETPFFKDVERSIELNIIEPLSSNIENYNFVLLVIQGGGWK